MKVRVYFNLHKRLFSVQDYKTRKVIKHVDRLVLKDVEFKVYEKGRQRVIKEGRKNVHAYVIGEIVEDCPAEVECDDYYEVFYSPYRCKFFESVKTKKPVYRCDMVSLGINGDLSGYVLALEGVRNLFNEMP